MFVRTVESVLFFDLEKSGTFSIRNRILQDTGEECFKPHKPRSVDGETQGEWDR